MRVGIISFDDGISGSGKAAAKLYKSLNEVGINSSLHVGFKSSTSVDSTLLLSSRQQYKLRFANLVETKALNSFFPLESGEASDKRSTGLLGSGAIRRINELQCDIVQLTFVAGLLSVKEIAKINKPVVWRLSDMWPFLGTKHYTWDSFAADTRRDVIPRGLEQWAINRKIKFWKSKFTLVCPSNWLADRALKSPLVKNWPIKVIPTPIDTELFKPFNQRFARIALGLPETGKVILFCALGGVSDFRKGGDIVTRITPQILTDHPDTYLVIVGATNPGDRLITHERTIFLGPLYDQRTVALAYNAANLAILPSRQDNLPQVGLEAQTCGCPVVTFKTSGLSELISPNKTGLLVNPFDENEFAAAINQILNNPDMEASFRKKARQRALQQYDLPVVGEKYKQTYKEVLAASQN